MHALMTTTASGGSGDPHREAMTRILQRRAVVQGSITLPAVPGLLSEYVAMCLDTFAAVGVVFDDEQAAHLRSTLETQLTEAYSASPRSEIVIGYDVPVGHVVTYTVTPRWRTLPEAYDAWVADREPPYFGTEPDARVWALSGAVDEPAGCRVLDLGAGTGRNALALARRGHPVDALEASPAFVEVLRTQAQQQGLDIRILPRDMFATSDDLHRDYGLIVMSEVASDFRGTADLRRVFDLAAACLAPAGLLVLNAFVARPGYEPDDAARQLGQQTYTSVFTRSEVLAAAAGLPLELVDDHSVHDFEHDHLEAEHWPPTGWYIPWVSGQDLFALPREDSPVEMRWLVFRRTS